MFLCVCFYNCCVITEFDWERARGGVLTQLTNTWEYREGSVWYTAQLSPGEQPGANPHIGPSLPPILLPF